jgi:chitinase
VCRYSSDIYADLQKHYPGDSWGEVGTNAYGCIKQVYILKKQNRKLKVLLSIGGWTYSPNFAAAVSTDASRAKFASTAVTLMKDWGFDGTDIDWEYPVDSSQASNFVLLLQAVHRALNQYSSQYGNGYHFLLTAASPAGPTHYNTEHLRAMDGVLDMWNLMAYDYAGSWDNTTGHQANLYPSSSNPKSTPFSTDRAVTDYLAAGVTPSKIQLGMPIYGRAFDNTQLPVGSSYSGLGPGSWEAGIWDYKVLPRAGATEYYDSEAGASYAYDASAKELVSYDTVRSVQAKATYLMGKNLGGTMFWEAGADRRDGGSLTRHNSK